jgi:hypothetical protein
MMLCNVCHAELADPVYRGGENTSITTMNKVVSGQTRIFHCRTCDHVQTEELPDLARYYAEEYSINEDGVDDDQLYEIRDGKEIYRSEHQAAFCCPRSICTTIRRFSTMAARRGRP